MGHGIIKPLKIKRDHLSPVSADHLQVGELVKPARQDHADHLYPRFVMPAPTEQRQSRGYFFIQSAVVRLLHLRQRNAGMHIEGHLQFIQLAKTGS